MKNNKYRDVVNADALLSIVQEHVANKNQDAQDVDVKPNLVNAKLLQSIIQEELNDLFPTKMIVKYPKFSRCFWRIRIIVDNSLKTKVLDIANAFADIEENIMDGCGLNAVLSIVDK